MKAMILAAGRGERMRPLSDTCPKPLLNVAGRALIEWQIERLVAARFTDLVINHAWLGHMVEDTLGNGSRYGARIVYAPEQDALETLGGIVNVLPYFEDSPFVIVSADVYTHFDYSRLVPRIDALRCRYPQQVGHLVLTDNPPYHSMGDMGLEKGVVTRSGPLWTYANIAALHPRAFDGLARGQKIKLFPWLYRFVPRRQLTGETFHGEWTNVGTPDDLAHLNQRLMRIN